MEDSWNLRIIAIFPYQWFAVFSQHYFFSDGPRKLLHFAKDHHLGPAIWIATLAGLRPNEIQALRWDSVDFEKSTIFIKSGFKRKAKEMEPYPKQRKLGLAPMPVALSIYLKRLMKSMPAKDDFVAPGPKGGMLSYQTFIRALKRLCDQANLTIVCPHELRHSCTELWIEQGATEEDLVRLLNHVGSSSVRRYIHPNSDRLIHIGAKIDVSLNDFGHQPQGKKVNLKLV